MAEEVTNPSEESPIPLEESPVPSEEMSSSDSPVAESTTSEPPKGKVDMLWNALSKDEVYKSKVGSIDEFKTKMANPEKAKMLWRALSQDKIYASKVGDEKTFLSKVSSPKPPASSTTGGESGAYVKPITPSTPTSASEDLKSASWTKTANPLAGKPIAAKPVVAKPVVPAKDVELGSWVTESNPLKPKVPSPSKAYKELSKKEEEEKKYQSFANEISNYGDNVPTNLSYEVGSEALRLNKPLEAINFFSQTLANINKADTGQRIIQGDAGDTKMTYDASKNPSYSLYGIGNAMFQMGDYEQALTYYNEAKAADPSNSIVDFGIARSKQKLGLEFKEDLARAQAAKDKELSGEKLREQGVSVGLADQIEEEAISNEEKRQAAQRGYETADMLTAFSTGYDPTGGLGKLKYINPLAALTYGSLAEQAVADVGEQEQQNKIKREYSGLDYITGGVTKVASGLTSMALNTVSTGSRIIANSFGTDLAKHSGYGGFFNGLADKSDDVVDYVNEVAKKYPIPTNTFLGKLEHSVLGAVPLIATMTLLKGRAKTTELKNMRDLSLIMGTEEGTRSFTERYKERRDFGDALTEGGKGFVTGLESAAKLEVLMGVGKKVLAPVVAIPALKFIKKINPKFSSAAQREAFATQAGNMIGVSTVFGGDQAMKDLLNKRDVGEDALVQTLTGAAFETLPFAGAARDIVKAKLEGKRVNKEALKLIEQKNTENALSVFFRSDNEAIVAAHDNVETVDNLETKAAEIGMSISGKTDLEEIKSLLYAQVGLNNIANVKKLSQIASDYPEVLIEKINESNIEEKDKVVLRQKVEDLHKELNPYERKVTKISDEIEEIGKRMIDFEGTDILSPADQARAKIKISKLEAMRKAKEDEMNRVISDKEKGENRPSDLRKNTDSTDENWGTINRNDGKGVVPLNKRQYEQELIRESTPLKTTSQEKRTEALSDEDILSVQKKQAELGQSQHPMDDAPSEILDTVEKMEAGEDVTEEERKTASNYLYNKYKELRALKKSPERMYTVDQIDVMLEQLGKDIELLESKGTFEEYEAEQDNMQPKAEGTAPVEEAPKTEAGSVGVGGDVEKTDAQLIQEIKDKQKQKEIDKQNEPALPVTENTDGNRKGWNDAEYERKIDKLQKEKDDEAKRIKGDKTVLSVKEQNELDESNQWHNEKIAEYKKERAERLQAKNKGKNSLQNNTEQKIEGINNDLPDFNLEYKGTDGKTGDIKTTIKDKDGKTIGFIHLNNNDGKVKVSLAEIFDSGKGIGTKLYKQLNKALVKSGLGELYSDTEFLKDTSTEQWTLDGKVLTKEEKKAITDDVDKLIELDQSGRLGKTKAVQPAVKLWEKLVKEGVAEKTKDGYKFKAVENAIKEQSKAGGVGVGGDVKQINILGSDIALDKPQRKDFTDGEIGDLEYANANMEHNKKVDEIIIGLNQDGILKDNQGNEYIVSITNQGVRIVNKMSNGTEGANFYYRKGKRVSKETPFTNGFSFKPKSVEQPLKKTPTTEEVVAVEGSTVKLPPLFQGGMERTMVFKDGNWQQEVGGSLNRVGDKVKAEADEAFKASKKPKVVGEKVEVKNAPKGNHLNIGLLEGRTNERMSSEDVLSKLPKDVKVISFSEVEGTEPTLSVETSRPLTDAEMTKLLEDTKQQAIPQLTEGIGVLYDVKRGTPEGWGEFNPEYFVTQKGENLKQYASKKEVAETTPTVEAVSTVEGEVERIEIPRYFTFKELGGGKGKSGKVMSSVEADKNEEIAENFKQQLQEGDKLIEPNGTVTYFKNGKVVKADGSMYGMVDIPAFITGVTIERSKKPLKPKTETTKEEVKSQELSNKDKAEIKRIEDDIEYSESKIEDFKGEIEIEKGNLKEEKARIKQEKDKVRASSMSKKQKVERLEELDAELEDAINEHDDLVQQYRDDIAQEKSDIKDLKKEKAAIEKKVAPKTTEKTEEPVEETTQKPVEKPVEKPAEEPAEEPVEEPVKEEEAPKKTEREVIEEYVDMFDSMREEETTSKEKREMAEKMKQMLDENPNLKLIFDNIKNINKSLEDQGLITKTKGCP